MSKEERNIEKPVEEKQVEKLIEKGFITYKYIHKGYAQGFKKIEVCKKFKKFPPSMTDKSYFIPTSEENKSIDKNALMSHDPSKYDFPNGEITGNVEKLASIRKPGADITEITEIQKQLVAEANDSIMNDAKNKIDIETAMKQAERENIKEIATNTVNAGKTE